MTRLDNNDAQSQNITLALPMVLLVDDSETDNIISRRVLSYCNFSKDVLTFSSAIKALQYLKENQTEISKLPDFIFLDINMPVMDGFGFMEGLQHFYRQLAKPSKIIVLSSSSNMQDMTRMQGYSQVVEYWTKPMHPKDIECLKQKR